MSENGTTDIKALERLLKAINEKASKKMSKNVNKNFKTLQTAASNYKKYIDDLTITMDSTKLEKMGDYSKAKEKLIQNLKNEETLNQIHTFQTAIDKFFNRKIILSIVTDDGDILFYNKMKEQELYSDSLPNKARLNLAISKVQSDFNLNDLWEKIFGKDTEESQHAELVKNIFRLSSLRYDKTYDETKKPFIYWHDNQEARVYAFVKNKGLLGEGYAAALFEDINTERYSLLDRDKGPGPGDAEDIKTHNDANLEPFYYHYILAADSRAGAIIGDIANSMRDKVQLAVKSVDKNLRNASSESFSALYAIATEILKVEGAITPAQLEEQLKKAEQTADGLRYHTLITKISDAAKEGLNSSLSQAGITNYSIAEVKLK